MKYAYLSAIALAAMVCVGCQESKPASPSSSLDLSATPAPEPTPAPVAYQQPITTSTPDASLSGGQSSSTALASGASYTIQPGDTLWKIAANHYGNGHKWQQIADANPGLQASHLRVGQTITLP